MAGASPSAEVSGSPNGHIKPDKTQSTTDEPSKSTSNATDQPRQKRRKARRACLACQRAHLTCSDDRPCQRCIKRGLDADCHDGMRKKAKYLHDAPNEALMPGAEQTFKFSHDKNESPVEHRNSTAVGGNGAATLDQTQPFQHGQPMNFQNFPQNMETSPSISSQFQTPIGYSPYGNQTSPMQPQVAAQPQLPTPIQNAPDNQPFRTPMFDVNDPTLNFDLAGMNFGNHYGALEFGMLGQIAGGAQGTMMQRNNSGSFESPRQSSNYLGDSPGGTNLFFNPPQSGQDPQGLSDNWALLPNVQEQYYPNNSFMEPPNPYSVGSMPLDIADASTQPNDPGLLPFYDQTISNPTSANPIPNTFQQDPSHLSRARDTPEISQEGPNPAISRKLDQMPSQMPVLKRRREPATIYSSVNAPYAYTKGFHTLTELLGSRFRADKRGRIAQALASVRPSFISCTRNLITEDLVFMEKCFQRQLLEFEDLITSIGTPTIVCRRTGEVAYAAKEFSLMTGWSQSVLLGHAPNLNVNKPPNIESNSGTMSGSSRGGMNTPQIPANRIRTDPAEPRPVCLPELMDDESVVEFFEDFAKLAFADSKGSAIRPCKLVKYRTKEQFPSSESPGEGRKKRKSPANSGVKKRSRNSVGIQINPQDGTEREQSYLRQLGDKEGKIDCMYCWTVKRDVFDIPLMIVINFLPMNTD